MHIMWKAVVRPYSLFQSKSNSCICRNKTVNSINASMVRKAAHKSGEYTGWKFGFVCDLNNREPQSTIENPEPWSK